MSCFDNVVRLYVAIVVANPLINTFFWHFARLVQIFGRLGAVYVAVSFKVNLRSPV
ncbi:hypothetical protein SAMN04487905_111209 [Actinopolyspora xinjiangensis]|uniref:Uncharacterized protein n=1 Tax=Actinopolyspora xinjiangensis TaxID=405564 RepID=A0A1H0WDA5_9ACTN|nr:hypothetical protein SAMN04487905_111209 [Actinopolyspora xinjiangensis]